MSSEEKTFILGLGHQKCGTTWLYEYLRGCENFAQGIVKEYHIWDALDIPILRRNRLEKAGNENPFTPNSIRYLMQNSDTYYFDYFCSLLESGKNIAADITPSYSGLGAERLSGIRQNFERRGVHVKTVILVREPLSRIKSAVRFNMHRRNYNEGIALGETDFRSALEQYYKSEECEIRTRYQNIIKEAQNVFEDSQIYIGFYEKMFEPAEIYNISSYLGVRPRLEMAQVFVNKTKISLDENELDEIIKEQYSDVYEYIHEKYPVSKALWA